MKNRSLSVALLSLFIPFLKAQPPVVPSEKILSDELSESVFKSPEPVFYPETWFHFIGGNVSKAGITADLEAIAAARISGIQLFHGQFGGAWIGVNEQITCLSPQWDELVRFVAEECRRLGLRFTMQNCPGWAMSGGPWIKSENAMRQLVMSRTDIEGGQKNILLPLPQPSNEEWRDYRDIRVLAFPTPLGDTNEQLKPLSVTSSFNFDWKQFLSGEGKSSVKLPPVAKGGKHTIEATFEKPVTLRTIEFSSVNGFIHAWCYEPGVAVKVEALNANGTTKEVVNTQMPQASWQDDRPISLACDEVPEATSYRITIENKHEMNLSSLRLLSAARKNNWESEAGWTLRSIVRDGESPQQTQKAFIDKRQIIDVSKFMDKNGSLTWNVPKGFWTVLRFGHVNSGRKNAPAPPEGTGWECDKLSAAGPDAHFAGYIGRLADDALNGGLLGGMLLDSWECSTQTWTKGMDTIFAEHTGYELKNMLPALFGYVIDDHEKSSRFLLDWRRTVGDLFANKFYGRMAQLAKAKGIDIQYETAAGDIFPADIMEYYKHADVPMAEFWHPYSDNYVGAIDFKPIKPTASAARMYGKPRVAAEAFTSFELSFDEHLAMLKEVANLNFVEGVTHLVFHTYTHNPRTDWLPPGTSFGSNIGTPFLRGQTWWRAMPDFTSYLARVNYLLEAGRPVSDVLWYLGDEINHKPDQKIEIEGYKYDYCNPDALLNRLSVKNSRLVTPEGISYRLLWLPDNERMLPETLEKLLEFVRQGVIVVGNAPKGLATLKDSAEAQKRFDKAVKELWGKKRVIADKKIDDVLKSINIQPDIRFGENCALWLHRCNDDAEWYYVAAPFGKGFNDVITFRNTGLVQIWDPLTGKISQAEVLPSEKGSTSLRLELARAGSCFVVFYPKKQGNTFAESKASSVEIELRQPWKLHFPSGWGAPDSLRINELKAWKDLDISPGGKAFSGTVTYSTTFELPKHHSSKIVLDLGDVEMIATVRLNGVKYNSLWTQPYRLDISDAIHEGKNDLQVEVTSTWFNRLVYDASQPEADRKTWTISGPKDKPLRKSGLLGPVAIRIEE
ncbi:MAG: hypothetical protein LBS52_07055 [Dysgonamonadaceae bacterium]|jgi:hypothetical protein|nr:hypothetical protein [Dysgonamonadaceae bacterium]